MARLSPYHLCFSGLLTTGILLLPACTPAPETNKENNDFTVDIRNNNGVNIGTATLNDIGDGGVELSIHAGGISAGPHGMHFHVKADCSSSDFKSAGGHINPDGKPHGLHHPEGPDNADMPNGIAGSDGRLMVTVTNDRVTLYPRDDRPALLDEDGSALIIHINPDDGVTQPIGGAGARIACAPIILEE
ncbi:MAG: superoxide dismutase family protein [Maricaulaceae bacterium]